MPIYLNGYANWDVKVLPAEVTWIIIIMSCKVVGFESWTTENNIYYNVEIYDSLTGICSQIASICY